MARSLYYGHARTQSLVSEAHRCISEVQLSTSLAPGPIPHRPSFLPQSSTAQLSFQGSIGPATPPSVAYQSHDMGGAPPNYLPPQQGLGTGQLFDRSSVPPSPLEVIPRRSIDDFGVNISSAAYPNGSERRFATFPEKGRPGGIHGGYALRDGPPSLGAAHEASSSFSSSVADALGPPKQPPGTIPGQFGSIQEPAPNYDAPYTPPQGPSNWNAAHTRQNPSNGSHDDVILAYAAMDDPQHGEQGHAHDDDRHVRFGEVRDVDEEIERWGGPHQPPSSPRQQHTQPSAMRSSLDSGNSLFLRIAAFRANL
jgi:hypothetical protein